MLISLDTECTGLDLAHGAMPFLVTTCDGEGIVRYWEWPVDPLTREPNVIEDELEEIRELIAQAELVYMQNAKFDVKALHNVGVDVPWVKIRDTLVMGHLLASNHRHNLTDMCIEYLGMDIDHYEVSVKAVVQACRMIARREYPDWRIAAEGAPDMPSVKGGSGRDEDKPWKNDMWLPAALALHLCLPDVDPACKHRWSGDVSARDTRCTKCGGSFYWVACPEYANSDSSHTLFLGLEMERLIRERGLWKIYEHRLELPRVVCEMEEYGVTVIGEYTESTIRSYEEFTAESACMLQAIAAEYGHELTMAEGAALNDNMRDFFYGAKHLVCDRCGYSKRLKHWNDDDVCGGEICPKCVKGSRKMPAARQLLRLDTRPNLNLPVINGKKTGRATLDKDAMQEYLSTLEGTALDFVRILMDKRKHDTDLSYMQSYRRYWVQIPGVPGFYRIHPSINPCGTDHLRMASNSPNLQNVGKQEDRCEECEGKGCGFCSGTGKSRISVRYCFGPAPGREWWSMDYKQIENRIPPYECGEEKAIEVFEQPNQPPYWGSLYNLTASVLYPDRYWPLAEREGAFKREEPRLYKQAKFFNLARQYGCGRRKGDALTGIRDSFDIVDNEFPRLAALQLQYLTAAERTGWVQTLPDRSVDPTRGYPILASRTEDGRVLSTTPFNYHVSGTACWCKNMALVRCSDQLAAWRGEGFDGWIALEVHDEILFDFPKGSTMEENLARAMVLKGLMEQSGDNLIPRIPTPVSVEYHAQTWAQGVPC